MAQSWCWHSKTTNQQTGLIDWSPGWSADWMSDRENDRLMEEEEDTVQGYRDRIITQPGSSVGDKRTQEVIDWAGQM